MSLKYIGAAFALILCLLGCLGAVRQVAAGQALLVPNPVELRYQLIGDEPIAGPDGRSVVNGWSVLVFKDRREGKCFVAFKQGLAITAMEAATCPS